MARVFFFMNIAYMDVALMDPCLFILKNVWWVAR